MPPRRLAKSPVTQSARTGVAVGKAKPKTRRPRPPPLPKKPPGENELWFSKAQKCFKLGKTVMRGVHNALDKTIIIKATYLEKQALKKTFNNQNAKPLAVYQLSEQQTGNKMTKFQKGLKGHRKGKAVHSNVEKLILRAKERALKGSVKGRNISVHPQAEVIFKVADKLGVELDQTELGVWYKAARVATRIDFLGMHRKTNQRVLFELKTGYNTPGYTMPSFRLRYKPFTLLSLRDVHHLQLLASTIMYRHTFPGMKIGDAVLIQTPDNSTAKCYKLFPYIAAMAPAVDAALLRNA